MLQPLSLLSLWLMFVTFILLNRSTLGLYYTQLYFYICYYSPQKTVNMDLHQTRRQAQRLIVMYKIANNLIDINKQEYLQAGHTCNTQNFDNMKIAYHTNTDSYKCSLFPHTYATGTCCLNTS